jgi:hypothetical protein
VPKYTVFIIPDLIPKDSFYHNYLHIHKKLAEIYPATALKQTHEHKMIETSNENILARKTQQHEQSPEVEIFNEASIDLKLTKQLTFEGMGKQLKLDP